MIDKEMIQEMLWTNPVSLLAIKDKQVIDYLNNLIPYSSAFEIECDMTSNFRNNTVAHEKIFTIIPDIIDVNNDTSEQRYRIPNGLRGIICLYNICQQLKINSLLNPLSSIHYHVDCTDCESWVIFSNVIKSNADYILTELDTWLGVDTAVNRDIGSWFKANNLRTLEFRLGEMTFDYNIILKRIIHCNAMVEKIKDIYSKQGGYIKSKLFIEVDKKTIFNYQKTLTYKDNRQHLTTRIDSLQKDLDAAKVKEEGLNLKAIRQQIRNRTITNL